MSVLMGFYEQALPILAEHVATLAAAGVTVDPGVDLRRGQGMLSYYSRDDDSIYLCLAYGEDPEGQLLGLYVRSLFGFTAEDLDRMTRFLLPWTVAHELGHCLRHRLGLFGSDLFVEEQAANELASALTDALQGGSERAEGIALLDRAVESLRHTHRLDSELTAGLERLVGATTTAERTGDGALEDFKRRFATDYATDPVGYVCIQLSWTAAYLRGPPRCLGQVVRTHLGPRATERDAVAMRGAPP